LTKTVTVRFVFRTPRHQYVLMLLGLGMVALMGCHAVVLCLRASGASAARGGGEGGGADGVGWARGAKSD
jgi:hypothetical protein